MKRFLMLLAALSVPMLGHFAWALEDDLYGEQALPAYREPEKKPEQAIVLPPYPSAGKLIEVDLFLSDFPFTLLIDAASLQVDDDGVIRYTAVLRSATGAENVVHEGLHCIRRHYRRYAYGSQSQLQPFSDSQWQRLRRVGQDRYRAALLDNYFCPLPSGDREAQILRKLRQDNPGRHLYHHE